MSVLEDLAGPVARYYVEDNDRQGPAFFRPYHSESDAAIGVASIITAPVIFPVASITAFVLAGYELLKAIRNALTGYSIYANGNLRDSAALAIVSLVSALLAPCSPLINLIDVIGSLIVTAVQGEEEAAADFQGKEEEAPADLQGKEEEAPADFHYEAYSN